MYSKAKIGGHPLHPMLVAFPITFYLATFGGFVVYQAVNPDIFWFKLAYFSNFAAVVSALVAAVPGIIDWTFGIPKGTAAKRDGLIHMSLNLVVLAIYAINAYAIWGTWETGKVGLSTNIFLTAVGSLLLTGAGFYGWKMIGDHKVGVDLSPAQERYQDLYEREVPFVPPHEKRNEQPPMFH
ncbi:MAG: DUF2231 domain-containing protein [Bacillota bacterium]